MLHKLITIFINRILTIHQLSVYQSYRNKYQLHPLFKFNGKGILFYGSGEIITGKESYIGYYSSINSVKNCKVTIGKGCHISHNVRMYTRSPKANQDFSVPSQELKRKKGNISIGDYVWIGVNVYIGPGVTIGDNAVIGANSVVTMDIPPYSINIGNPIQLVKFKDCAKND